MSQQPETQQGIQIKFPTSLQLKDLIVIVSSAVSLTVAWGVFSTRMTVLEREVLSLQTTIDQQQIVINKIDDRVRKNSAHQQDDELLIDQAYFLLNRQPPTRRARD